MRLVKGKRYQWWYVRTWIYDGLYSDLIYTCDGCSKERKKLHWFHAEDNKDDTLKLGTECVKEMRLENDSNNMEAFNRESKGG